MFRKITFNIIVALFIILWIPAASSKLRDYEKFRFQLGRSPYIQDIAAFVAIAVPVSEIIIALLLLFNATRLLGLYASFFMMLLFTGYLYMMLYHSYFMPCSCGGILKVFGLEENWYDHFIFNIAVTTLAVVGIIVHTNVNKKTAAFFSPTKSAVQ